MREPAVVPHHTDSNGWWETLSQAGPVHSLIGDRRVSTVIVGGGICGVSVAHRLGELCPSDDICLLEAERVGFGASGRNAGFMLDMHAHGEPKNLDILRRNINLWQTGLDSLRKKVSEWQIQCDWQEAGRYYGAAGPDGLKKLNNVALTLESLEREHTLHDSSDMQRHFGTAFYEQGLHASGSALVNPAALMRGLAAHLPANVEVLEHTPVTRLEQKADGYRLVTPAGSIVADRVVLATGVFLKDFGIASVNYLPMATYASLTKPLKPAQLEAFGDLSEFGILGASEIGSTIRLTLDHRLMVRNHYHYASGQAASREKVSVISQHHRKAMLARWPSLEDVEFEHAWGGIMAFTRNNGTVFGEVQPNLYAILTNDVSPMTRGEATGKLLAEHIEGMDSELLSLQLAIPEASKLPARPFLDIGLAVRNGWINLRAGKEL